MNFAKILNQLSELSIEQRQLLINKALELAELSLLAEDEALIDERLAAHHLNPASSVPLSEMKTRLQDHFFK